jgi:plastocyanin
VAVPAVVVDADEADDLDAIEALEAPTLENGADMDDLEALYASVTPSAHPDMGANTAPAKASAKAKAAAANHTRAVAASSSRAATPAQKARQNWKRIAAVVATVMLIGVVRMGALNADGAGAAPAASSDPNAAAATQAAPAVDQAKLDALMVKLQANPKDVETLMAVATEFYAGEQYTEAGGFLDKVLAIDPNHVKALLAKGAVAFNTGDNAAAKASWDKVIAIEPDNQEVHYDLGFMYLNQTNPDWAGVQSEWQQVVDIDATTELAQTVKSHLDALAKASMLPGASPAAAGSPAASSPAASPAAVAAPAGSVVALSAKDLAFGASALTAPAGTPFTIRFANEDALPHDVQITDSTGTVAFKGDLLTGPGTVDYAVPALAAGAYTFVCSIHPTMTGTLTVGS